MGRSSQPQNQSAELLSSLGDFTSKENWDKFFTIRGADDSFEWYAEWDQLHPSLLPHLPPPLPPPQILVPGCGNSTLSEHLYDAGFHAITNIDFSKVVISDMLRRNIRQRPNMRWRVMDITSMQFMDETFDAVLDKGGLDALMEPELGPKLGNQYLSEVKRVLKCRGKFICLTLAESHVLGLLFPMFRFGWKMSLHAIPQKGSIKPTLRTFMVVAEKENSEELHEIKSSLNHSSLACDERQASGLFEALEKEERVRKEYSIASEVLFTLEDLRLGAKGDLTKFSEGRRFQLTLGGHPSSRFSYRAVLLDAHLQSSSLVYHCAVFIVPQNRAHEWLFSSEEGQWQVVESSKAARLIMVFLDSSHITASMEELQKDLSPLVKDLAPGKEDHAQIPFMMASDGIKKRSIVHQVSSSLSGPIVVEDVVYENVDDDDRRLLASRDLVFRRLIFQRSESLVQSEALLTREGSSHIVGETDKKRTGSTSKSKKKGTQKQNNVVAGKRLDVCHNYLASSYHTGIISGFVLISSYLEAMAAAEKTVNSVVIGLGAGLLPMFLHGCMPYLKIEVVELDPVIVTVAKEYFGFIEDKNMKVHIADGIQYIKDFMKSVSDNGNCSERMKEISKVDILIIDVDSADSSSGMTCPAADFVEESFLWTVKDILSEQGLFIINLVSRSPSVKEMVISRLKEVFSSLFSLQLKEDVNEVLFALLSENSSPERFMEANPQFEKLLSLRHASESQNIINASKKIRCLK